MQAENWDKVKEVFLAVVAFDPGKRALFLNSLCDGDDDLRREVESLLKAEGEAETLYETPVLKMPTAMQIEYGDFSGRIGAYKVEREIGRGGMGAVYLATRDDDQFKKKVAVKFIRHTANNKEAVRRFRDERQILAALEHPNIARLLDGGETDDGSPYLVMEYVEGLPLLDFCEEKNLTTDERLKIFIKICGAVHYAHQHLVIHRDLKPANILVTKDGEPKLLDFGIAKLLNPDLRARDARETVPAQRLLTPEYASPEQIHGDPISTASDVYSLGVVLYELLTGVLPYELKNKRLDEIARIISETNPSKPSDISRRESGKAGRGDEGTKRRGDAEKGRRGDEGKTKILGDAETRQAETDKVKSSVSPSRRLSVPLSSFFSSPFQIKDDLDNIVLMAMRKEPERRYKSVEEFGNDLRRYLENLPVIAREDTFSYRASKFINRHRIGAAAAAIVLLAILSGIAATVWQARVAAAERDRAQTAQAKAERINRFLQKMLGSAAPDKDGREVKVLEILENAERQAREELIGQPEILAEVLYTIGGTYVSLAQYEPAEKILRAALEVYERVKDEELGRGRCVFALANVQMKTQNYEAAEPLLRRAVEILRRSQPQTNRELVEALSELGISLVSRERIEESKPFFDESLTLARTAFGEGSEEVLFALHAQTFLYDALDNPAGEINIYRQIIPILEKIPSARDDLATTNLNLGLTLLGEGNTAEAAPVLEEAARLYRELYGAENVRVASATAILAQLRVRQKRYAEAETEAAQALAIQKKYLPPASPMFNRTWSALGMALTKQGRAKEGEPYLRQALDDDRKNFPPGGWAISVTESRLGECLAEQKRFAEAEPLLVRGYENIKTHLGEKQILTVEALQRVVKFYEDAKQPERAAEYRKLLPPSGRTE